MTFLFPFLFIFEVQFYLQFFHCPSIIMRTLLECEKYCLKIVKILLNNKAIKTVFEIIPRLEKVEKEQNLSA